MNGKTILGVLVMMAGVAGLILLTLSLPIADRISADEKERLKDDEPQRDGKPNTISVDVVIEEVDLAANTVTARSTLYVVPPHDQVGGTMLVTGTTDSHHDQATKYVRLPVMPSAKFAAKKPRVGDHAILQLEPLRQVTGDTLVVVGIEEFTGLERIGVNWLDAPGTSSSIPIQP